MKMRGVQACKHTPSGAGGAGAPARHAPVEERRVAAHVAQQVAHTRAHARVAVHQQLAHVRVDRGAADGLIGVERLLVHARKLRHDLRRWVWSDRGAVCSRASVGLCLCKGLCGPQSVRGPGCLAHQQKRGSMWHLHGTLLHTRAWPGAGHLRTHGHCCNQGTAAGCAGPIATALSSRPPTGCSGPHPRLALALMSQGPSSRRSKEDEGGRAAPLSMGSQAALIRWAPHRPSHASAHHPMPPTAASPHPTGSVHWLAWPSSSC